MSTTVPTPVFKNELVSSNLAADTNRSSGAYPLPSQSPHVEQDGSGLVHTSIADVAPSTIPTDSSSGSTFNPLKDPHHRTIFFEWAKMQEPSAFGNVYSHWRSEYNLEHHGSTIKKWAVSRGNSGAYAHFSIYDGEEVLLELNLKHMEVVNELPRQWQDYYDRTILIHPRRAKLLDRVLTEVLQLPPGHYQDFWGSVLIPATKERDDLLLMLVCLESYGYKEKYSDFVSDLQEAYNEVYRSDLVVNLQSGFHSKRKHVNVSAVSQQNQSREFSVKQMQRVRRDIIQRAAAKAKEDALRDRVPYTARSKIRTLERKGLRKLKQVKIDSQSGMSSSGIATTAIAATAAISIGAMCWSISRSAKRTADQAAETMRFLENASNRMDGIVETAIQERVVPLIDSAAAAVNTAGRVADTADGFLSTITQALLSLKKSFEADVPKILLNTIMVGLIVYLFTKIRSPLLRTAFIGSIGVIVGPTVYSAIAEFFQADVVVPEQEGVEQQSGFDNTLISKVIGSVLMVAVFKSAQPKDFPGLLKHLVLTLAAAPRLFKGIESFTEFIITLTETGVNTIRIWLNKPPIRFANKFGKILGDLAERIYAYEHLEATGTTGKTASERYTHLMSLNNEISIQLQIHSSNKDIKAELLELRRTVNALSHPLRQAVGSGAGYRVQPASVIIAGVPGIGKTSMVQAMAITLMRLSGELPENASLKEAEQSVFTKPANSAFMDGYQDQFCYLIDDLFQIKPTPNLEGNGFADIMAMYGSFTTMLNMAECEKKGMFPFVSKLLLMTTNCTGLEQAHASQILLKPEAFKRRIDFHVEIVVKEQFRKKGSMELDFAKFQAEYHKLQDLDIFPWHVWEYHEVDFDDNRDLSNKVGKPFKELLIRIAERIRLNKHFHERQEEMLERLLKAPITPDWTFESIQKQSGLDGFVEDISDDDWDLPNVTADRVQSPDDSDDGLTDTMPELEHCSVVSEDVEVQPDSPIPDKYWTSDFPYPGNSRMRREREAYPKLLAFKKRIKAALDAAYTRGHKAGHDLAEAAGINLAEWFGARCFENGVKNSMILMSPFVLVGGYVIGKAIISLVVELVTGFYRWIKKMVFGSESKAIEEQSNAPKPRVVRFVKQAGGEVPMLWHLVYENTFKLAVNLGDRFITMGQVLFLKETAAVMPYHFIEDLTQQLQEGTITFNTMLVLRGCQKEVLSCDIKVGALLRMKRVDYPERDLCFIDFNRSIQPRRKITKYILHSSEIDDIGGHAVRLDTARMDKNGVLIDYNDRETFISPTVAVGKVPIEIGGTIHKRWLRYQAETVKGDCGAVLSLTDHSSFSCRLVAGLHVGYDHSWKAAYATPLDSEICEEALKRLGIREVTNGTVQQSGWDELGITTEPLHTLPFSDYDSDHFGSFTPLMSATPGLSQPIFSSLEPTPMGSTEFFKEEIASFYDGREPDTLEVMKLHTHDGPDGRSVYPMAEAMRPFAGDVRIIDQNDFGLAVSIAMKPFNTASRDCPARKLTFDEAVTGVPSMGLKAITRQTSVGYPWAVKAKNKKYFFGSGDEYDLNTAAALKLRKEVEDLDAQLQRGERPFFVCRDFLKDEVRKKGKSARLIAGTDLRYYILCRMYYGAYVGAHMTKHRDSGICIGMNQYSEWQWLQEHILRPGDNVWDGDFAGFDQSEMPSMLWPLCKEINSWYSQRGGGDDNRIRELLFYDLAHSRHLTAIRGVATTILEWAKSLPSGHFLTAIINSMFSASCVVSGFIKLTGRIDFWKHCSVATQGDDNICSTSNEYIDVFNQITLAKHLLEEYGLVYTAGRKGEELQKCMSIQDITFLQRRFAWKNGVVVCPIRPESFLHSLYYTKGGNDLYKKQVVVNSIEDAFQELSMHTEDMWHKVAPKLVQALNMYGEVPNLNVSDSSAYFDLVRQRVPEWL